MNNVVKGLLALGGIVAVAAAGFLGYVAMQPGELAVSKTITVKATPDDVAPYARDLRKWNEWSPWADIDPEVQAAYSDPSDGKGAWYSWEGNDDVGKGKMTVTTDAEGQVVHEVAFERPMEDVAESTIRWKATDPEHTEITWSFRQEAGFGTKLANVLMDIETMLQGDYDKGMVRMQPLVEKAAAERIAAAQQEAADQAADGIDDEPEAEDAMEAPAE